MTVNSMEEVGKLITEQGTIIHQIREKQEEIEKRGADPVTKEQIQKLNDSYDDIEDIKSDVVEMKKSLARAGAVAQSASEAGINTLSDLRSGLVKLAEKGAQVNGHMRHLMANQETPAEIRSGFDSYLRKGDNASPEAIKSLTGQTDPDGGYVVIPELAGQIIKTVFETTPFRQLASVQTISTREIQFLVDKDEAGAEWEGEEETPSETTTPQLAKITIPTHELRAKPKATQQILEDSAIDLESWLIEKISERFARKENQAFITGDGVGKPKGITAYDTVADASYEWGKVGFVVSGASGAFASSNPADKILDLFYSLKDEYAANASFLMRREVAQLVRQFKESTTNAYIWQPGLQLGEPDRLLGAPLVRAQDMPAIGANSLSVAVGDFRRAYQIVDRVGISVLRDPYSAKPNIEFYTRKRTGGGLVNFEAIKLMKFST